MSPLTTQHQMFFLQTVLSGMGELHLEVVEERLKRVYGVECELGPLQVAYRESLLRETFATGGAAVSLVSWFMIISTLAALDRAIGSSKHSVFARVGLYPREPGNGVSVSFGSEVKLEKSMTQVLSSAVETSLTRGGQWTNTPSLPHPLLPQALCWGSPWKVSLCVWRS